MLKKELEVLALLRRNPYLSQQEMAEQLNLSRPSVANLISGLIRKGKIAGRAYVLPEEGVVVSIGGANVDRKFRLSQPVQMATSNPASASGSVGGVARNVAENLGRLGHPVKLLSIAGNDPEWRLIEEQSAPFMSLELTKALEGLATGTYTAVLQPDGELVLALADMAIYDSMTPEYIKRSEAVLMGASFLVADLNCPKETIGYIQRLAKARDIPLAVIPVSEPKMDRLGPDLSGISWLILNRGEAARYLGTPVETPDEWRAACEKLMEHGVQNIVITGGGDGVVAGNIEGIRHFAAHTVPAVVDVTGAGDAFSGGLIHAVMEKLPLKEIINAGLVNAAKTLQSELTVRSTLSAENLQKELEEIL
ncbi:carbohydrate kinase [Planococcus chinensis]|uniref:Carbohydrate kinase n=1 Tax=Planococcus chinensis TaxID=272917 RepID=A0ABW4QLW4_9BACL